jgi:hypothetical protein
MVQLILLFLGLFKVPFRAMGVDYAQLQAILKVKLTMDNRRRFSASTKQKKASNQLIFQAFVYGLLGLFFGFLVMSIDSPLVGYTFFFSFLMIMIAMLMISEFTNVLIDTRDNNILLPRPINSRTLTMAKIIHIAVYLMLLSLSLSLASFIFTWIKFGFGFACLFLILVSLSTLFTLFLTNIFYLGLMSLVDGQKLRDILVYFQVAIAILFMGAYQLMPRMMDHINIADMSLEIHWWTYLVPPVWMSGTMECLTQLKYDWIHYPFVLSGFIMPIISLWFVIKVLAPKFDRRLSQLDVAGSKPATAKSEKRAKKGYAEKLAAVFTRTQEEATAFKMVWLMSGRERKYKQAIFPAYGYILILGLVFAFRSDDTISLEALAESKKYLVFIYMSILLAFGIIQNLGYSDQPKSSWFYRALPLSKPGQILIGATKSVLVKYYLPAYLLICIATLSIWGINVLDDLVYGGITVVLITALINSWQSPQIPFSKERETQEMGNNFAKGIILIFTGSIIGGLHYGLSFLPYSVSIAIPVLLLLMHFTFRSYRNLQWNSIID